GTGTAVTCSVTVPVVTGLSAAPLSFSSTPTIAGASTAVTISTTVFTPASPAGGYLITFSCGGQPAATFALNVTPATQAFTTALSPTSSTVPAGGSTCLPARLSFDLGTGTAVTCSVTVPVVTGLSAAPLSFSSTPTIAGASTAVTISTTVFTPA